MLPRATAICCALAIVGAGCSDDEAPRFVPGAALRATAEGTIGPSPRSVELVWARATDNVAVTRYVVRLDDEVITETHRRVRTATIKNVGFATPHTFSVSAFDEAGNESRPITTIDAVAPAFPQGAQINFAFIEAQNTLRLRWPPAEDDGSLSRYRVQHGDDEIATLAPDVLEHTFESMPENGRFAIEAIDTMTRRARISAPGIPARIRAAHFGSGGGF